MNAVKISNTIFDQGMTANEVVVYAYLLSIHATVKTLAGNSIVTVKQSTIAEKCNIRSLQTVRRILAILTGMGLVEPIKRNFMRNGHRGTYEYEIKPLPTSSGYFMVPRRTFGLLSPRQMYVYMFLCKAESIELWRSWNSYNDISDQIHMKREMVVKTIRELVELKLVVRMRRKAKDNPHVFVDNHYQIIRYVRSRIRKRKVQPYRKYDCTGGWRTWKCSHRVHSKYITWSSKCQVFFSSRGSP